MTKNPNAKVSRRKNPKKISFANAHPLIAANYDKSKTLTQNYAAMGLVTRLNNAAGGSNYALEHEYSTEKTNENSEEEQEIGNEDEHLSTWAKKMGAVSVINPNEGTTQDIKDESDSDIDLVDGTSIPDVRAIGIISKIGHTFEKQNKKSANTTSIIEAMIKESESAVKIIRHVSEQEEKFLVSLRNKYGDDLKKMSRDSKLNPFLLTSGQLKKKFEKLELQQK